jgi:hypothetical protein
MRILGAFVALALLTSIAAAEDKVLVLRAEGRADKKIRTKVEAAVLKLAKANVDATTAGDITYTDAAAMVGCKPDEDKCKDEVIGMLAVDEIVTITTTPKPGGIDVEVRRIVKGGITKQANTLVLAEKADSLDSLAPLFMKAAPPSPLPPPITPSVTPAPAPAPIATPAPTPPPTTPAPPATTVPPPTTVADPTPPPPITAPISAPHDEGPEDRPSRLPMVGMGVGGVLVIAGIVFWASAANFEDQASDAPKNTRAEIEHVKELEQQGDDYASTGNVLTLTGLVVGGVSAYFFIKGRRSSSTSARITPTVTNSGAGLAVGGGF